MSLVSLEAHECLCRGGILAGLLNLYRAVAMTFGKLMKPTTTSAAVANACVTILQPICCVSGLTQAIFHLHTTVSWAVHPGTRRYLSKYQQA